MNKIQTSTPRRLGRGLSALIGTPVAVEPGGGERASDGAQRDRSMIVEQQRSRESTSAAAGVGGAGGAGEPAGGAGQIVYISLPQIVPSPHQPRKTFDRAQLVELGESIKSAGLIQPIVVRARARGAADGGDEQASYELIAGERRWRAAALAGMWRVPAVVVEISDEQAAEWALIENLQRADLSAMERAEALRSLAEKFSLTHAALAQKIGLDRSSVSNLIRLTELEAPVRAMLQDGRLTLGHGKALLACPPGASRLRLAARAVEQGWSVRRLERAIAPAPAGVVAAQPEPGPSPRAIDLRELEKQLGEHLGTRVRIRTKGGGKRGTLAVSFYDLDHFDGLMTKIGFVMR